jgi:O-acetyl-ADP-ribose deacetylase (regulator of RNase III)
MARISRWTSPSVAHLSAGRDPVAVIEERARDAVLKAVDKGWSGPPYDPIKLARLLGISVTASAEVQDARLISNGNVPKIEFNPNRPRARIRFSVAHEIAHTLFPDFLDRVHYRDLDQRAKMDREVEVLCNIAAAELIMPFGSFREVLGERPDINGIMQLRRDLDVSTEAILLRYIRLTDQPIAMFCASREPDETYVMDYAIGSRSWRRGQLSGLRVPKGSVLGHCSAIGFTSTGTEDWTDLGLVEVGCVGLPAFPGAVWPRVAGFIRLVRAKSAKPLLMRVQGDATQPRGEGAKIVCQLVNDRAIRWAPKGFVAAVRKRWPEAQDAYSSWIKKMPQYERLGKVHLWSKGDITIASLIAQEGWGPAPAPRIRYAALAACLAQVCRQAETSNATVHMPRIGAGQAGGNWDIVEELVTDKLLTRGVTTVIYDLPPRSERMELG